MNPPAATSTPHLIPIKPSSVLMEHVGARIPIIFVNAHNEDYRFINDEVASLIPLFADAVYVRDTTNSIQAYPSVVPAPAGAKTPKKFDEFTIEGDIQTIDWFCKEPLADDEYKKKIANRVDAGVLEKSVLIIFDLFRIVNDRLNVLRVLKKAAVHLANRNRSIVIVSNNIEAVPSELAGVASLVEFPLPSPTHIRSRIRVAGRFFRTDPADRNNPDRWFRADPVDEDMIVSQLRGFREMEVDNTLRRAARANMVKRKKDKDVKEGFDMDLIRQAKAEHTAKSPAINIIVPKAEEPGVALSGTDLIGGFGPIKDWFAVQQELFGDEARKDNIALPKGAVVFGVGGTGKDYLVRCLSQGWRWTNVEADMGAAKGPLVGESHRGLRHILKTAEDHYPCFLTMSEFEKMFAGGMARGSAASDAGTSSEMFATWLNWMQNRVHPIFTWALTNSIEEVPQPALRAERFDRVWFMDLPEPFDCREIFAVHLLRTGAWHDKLDLNELATLAATGGYTGAEIKQWVNEALIERYISRTKGVKRGLLSMDHLMAGMRQVVPTGSYRKDEVDLLRKFADDNRYQKANTANLDLTVPSPLLTRMAGQQGAVTATESLAGNAEETVVVKPSAKKKAQQLLQQQ